jgi:hypothetical protein
LPVCEFYESGFLHTDPAGRIRPPFFAGPAVAETAFRLAGAVRHTDEERTPVLSLMSDILDDR